MIDKFLEQRRRRISQGIIVYGQSEERNIAIAYEIVNKHIADDDSRGEPSESNRRHILANTFPNFMRVDVLPEKSDISVNETREIIWFLSQKPTLSVGRAVMIAHAEKMSKSASNSILKTLEELPTDSIVVMTANRLPAILPTIRSRCIKIHAKNRRPNVFECSDVSDYIERSISHLKKEYIRDVVAIITSGYKEITNFAKKNAETADDFLNILSAYYVYLSIKDEDYHSAEKTLKLQNLIFQLRTAFPDRQNAIIAASIMCCSS